MCISLSSTRLWQLTSTKKWVPIVAITLALLILIGTLGGCYAIANSNGDLNDGGPSLPPISLLGDKMPEHALFATGFFLAAICLAVALTFRACQLDEIRTGSLWNNLALLISYVGLIGVIIMALIPMSSPAGSVHLGAAGVGIALLSVYGLGTTALCVVWSCPCSSSEDSVPDSSVPALLRYFCYFFAVMCAIVGPVLFGVWLTNVDRTPFEWSGVSFVFASFTPLYIYFAAHDSSAAPIARGERMTLLP